MAEAETQTFRQKPKNPWFFFTFSIYVNRDRTYVQRQELESRRTAATDPRTTDDQDFNESGRSLPVLFILLLLGVGF